MLKNGIIVVKKIYAILILTVISEYGLAANLLSVVNLRCEYMVAPMGIDKDQPRISWELTSKGNNKRQTAWQAIIATKKELLESGLADVWDSGKTESIETNQILLPACRLRPFTHYYWRVRVWDENGKLSSWSSIAQFSTGAFSANDWIAQWVGEKEEEMISPTRYYPFAGYISYEEASPFTIKWITVDLGKQTAVDEIRLHPVEYLEELFPLHFKIEIADGEDFHNAKILTGEFNDNTGKDTFPRVKKFAKPVMGRYVRLTVYKMASAGNDTYKYALSEIEVMCNSRNIALNRPVTASDQRWPPKLLTDGYRKPEGAGYYNHMPSSPLVRKEIVITKKVERALYLTSALGIYEAYINGVKIGDQVMAPEWTDYDHHIQYQTHEVGHLLRTGPNALGAILADGWYAGARWSHPGRGGYGGFARKFLGQLVIIYADGTSETIGTDSSWKYLQRGPITSATMFGGEEYDAAHEQSGWNSPGFDDSDWKTVDVSPVTSLPERAEGKYILCAQMNEPIMGIAEIRPISVRKTGKNSYIFDMGQNMVGRCRLTLPYNPGKTITMRFAEVLDSDGSLYRECLRGATQTDIYRPGNEKSICYEPRFTYHGFRFVEIDGLTRDPKLSDLTGTVLASSSPVTGWFETSDRDVNKLWENIRWTQRGNMISVPTDCPQRDEREGWTADAQIFSQTAIYNLDMAGFYTKWARDIRDDQLPDGQLPDISPNDGAWANFYNAPGWADAGVIIPWRVYLNYGDTSIISEQYDCIKRYIDFIHSRNPNLIWHFCRGNMYGDHLNGDTVVSEDYPDTGGKIDDDVFSTAYFAYSTAILAKIARILKKEADHNYYNELAVKIKEAFVERFVSEDGEIKGNTQAAYALSLQFGLLPEELRPAAAARMAEAVKAYDDRMSTGIHTTIALMNQLCEYGYEDIAYGLLTSRRLPSWFYSIDQGATTVWERWDGYVAGRGFQYAGMNSFNHVAFGAVGEWMYSHILGIRPDEETPGYRRFYIHPVPGEALEWAKGGYRSINGPIEVAWRKKKGIFSLDVTIPPNTKATVVLPDGIEHGIESGKHHFESEI